MRNFIIITAEQRSDEWKAARVGRLTGSVAGDMLAAVSKGEAAGRRNLRLRLVLERLTGKPQEKSDYISPAMQTGIDREPDAFAAYEALTGSLVRRCGFLQHTVHMAGCSPDGYLGDFVKLLSIKCRQPAAHLEALGGKVPAAALAQIRHELWVTGAAAADYFSWNPDFPDRLQTRLVTITREDANVPGYERQALAFLAEVDNELLTLQTLANPAAQLAAAAGVV